MRITVYDIFINTDPFRKLKNQIYYGKQGILCNENAQVIDKNKDVIENLYVCGDNSGGFFVNNYPCLFAGVAMGRTMTFAIKAIKMAFGE